MAYKEKKLKPLIDETEWEMMVKKLISLVINNEWIKAKKEPEIRSTSPMTDRQRSEPFCQHSLFVAWQYPQNGEVLSEYFHSVK